MSIIQYATKQSHQHCHPREGGAPDRLATDRNCPKWQRAMDVCLRRNNKLFVILICLLLVSCGGEDVAETVVNVPTSATLDLSTAVPEIEPTATTIPTAPTATPVPTITPMPTPAKDKFDGERSMRFLVEQVEFGPRFPMSEGHLFVRDYIVDELEKAGWEAERQQFLYQNFPAENLIGRANIGKGEVIILGAHYDTRAISDQDPNPDNRTVATVGAVDGASGVAVLLEFANSLNLEDIDNEIWLAFFDVEDNGSNGLQGWDWIAGSRYMADQLTVPVEAMVLVDMIGDADQDMYLEGNSDPELQGLIWQIAADLGYAAHFINSPKYTMIDDHVPFKLKGIPAIDIIDFDYTYWHTVEDTPDKASVASLQRVGDVIQFWLESSGK